MEVVNNSTEVVEASMTPAEASSMEASVETSIESSMENFAAASMEVAQATMGAFMEVVKASTEAYCMKIAETAAEIPQN